VGRRGKEARGKGKFALDSKANSINKFHLVVGAKGWGRSKKQFVLKVKKKN